MIINITDTVRINYEEHNATIERAVAGGEQPKGLRRAREARQANRDATAGPKTKKEWDPVAHYPSIAMAAEALLNRHFKLLAPAVGLPVGRTPEVQLREVIAAVEQAGRLVAEATARTAAAQSSNGAHPKNIAPVGEA